VLAAAIGKDTGHRIFNVSDDEPAPPEDVVAYAAEMLGLPLPPAVPFEQAGLSGMAASFWAECKRVRNARIRGDLGVELLYPTYREGLRALASSGGGRGRQN
jgi:nucleoside-diphosphate-sugar epimerase